MRILNRAFLILMSALPLHEAGSGCRANFSDIRPPAVSGQFYPSNPARLRLAIEGFIKDALVVSTARPIGLIVPHAGYIYSGQICADGYRQAAGHEYDVIVILGTNHTAPDFSGISVLAHGAYMTPLGNAQVDEQVATALLAQDSDCSRNQAPQAREHSVEVQVPFVQTVFPKARIVPIVIGEPNSRMCMHFGQVLAKVLKDRKALIVASSDLSHYPPYSEAAGVDRRTLLAITKLDSQEFETATQGRMKNVVPNLATCACGSAPIIAAMTAAKQLGATRGVIVSYANSGDTSIGEKERVVGYGSVVLASGKGPPDVTNIEKHAASTSLSPLEASEKKALLKIARDTINRFLTTETVPLVRGVLPRLERPQGVFVTLREKGELRGCMGHMPADSPLARSVAAAAMQAAFNDPRFNGVQLAEMDSLEIEISALTPMKPITRPEDIVVGRDGVVLSKNGRSAVFLPQVATENNWGREEMLENLCRKAGLPPGSWKKDSQFLVFQAEVFGESHFR